MGEINKRPLLIGTFLLSFSVLVLELALIRWFSVVVSPAFSFLGVSLALFGVAIGGLIVYFWQKFFTTANWKGRLTTTAVIYGITVLGFVFVAVSFNTEIFLVHQFFAVPLLVYIAVPFVLANICLSALLVLYSQNAGQFYFLDLIGAGTGVLAAILLMEMGNVFSVMIAAGAFAFLSAAMFALSAKNRAMFLTCIVISGISTIFFFVNNSLHFFDTAYTRYGYEENLIFSKWNAFSRVAVQEEVKTRDTISLSPKDLPLRQKQYGVTIDADAYTPVVGFSGNFNDVGYLLRDLSSAAVSIRPDGQSLIIGSGGGRDILAALAFGHTVTAVEINPIVVNDVMRGILKEFSGNLYDNPKVKAKVAEGRSFISRDKNKYDVIGLPLVDTWASTVGGSFAAVENHLYTVEAFRDYLTHLNAGGILTITRWEYDGLRLVTLFREASLRLNIPDFSRNIVILKNSYPHAAGLSNYLFKKEPFKSDEIKALNKFAADNYFEVSYAPGSSNGSWAEQYVTSVDPEAFISNYPVNLDLVNDDSPFFFFHIPSSRIREVFIAPENTRWGDGGIGIVLRAVSILSLLCVLIPVAHGRLKGRTKIGYDSVPAIGYFLAIGLAFILIEISLVQKFVLYLERPIISYAVVLVVALLAAGAGSFLSEKIKLPRSKHIFNIVLGIVAMLGIQYSLSPVVVSQTIGLSLLLKSAIAIGMIAPLFLLMGMMLPLAIRGLNKSGNQHLIPWCWGVNGAFSVFGSALAVFLAIAHSFSFVLLVGGSLYIISLFFSHFLFVNKNMV